MCIVCIDWEKGKMNNDEALRALGEMIETDDASKKGHYLEVVDKILDKEMMPNGSTD